MKKDDRVRLIKDYMKYKAGSSGVIKKDYGDQKEVELDKNHRCEKLNGTIHLILKNEFLEKGKCRKVVTVAVVASQLQFHPSTIRRHIHNGNLHAFKDKNKWFIFEDSVGNLNS